MAQAAGTRTRTRPPRAAARRPAARSRRGARRRRLAAILIVAVLGAGAAATVAGVGPLGDTFREITLPLRHDDIIRQQAAEKGIDPALIAAVIYEESRFHDQTSRAGARGLMQITPETASFIARDSGGTRFTHADLATPQINIAYGSYYLRYLLRRYGGDVTLAAAAYNAGETNVNRWIAEAGGRDEFDASKHIQFPETRKYVDGVIERRDAYRDHYADELGL